MTMDPDRKAAVLWACAVAERVLSEFETDFPDDERPRAALQAGRDWAEGRLTPSLAGAAAFASHAAARMAQAQGFGRACAAARAAGHAAASARVIGHAHHASAYALKAADDPVGEAQLQRRALQNDLAWLVRGPKYPGRPLAKDPE